MNESIRQKILNWIYENHDHHEGAAGSAASLDIDNNVMSDFEEYSGQSECTDGDCPYVNSLELERFIKSL